MFTGAMVAKPSMRSGAERYPRKGDKQVKYFTEHSFTLVHT